MPRPITTIAIATPSTPSTETLRTNVSKLPALRKPFKNRENAQNRMMAVTSTIRS